MKGYYLQIIACTGAAYWLRCYLNVTGCVCEASWMQKVGNKIFEVSGLAITVVLNTKIRVVENKIPDISELKKQHVMMLK